MEYQWNINGISMEYQWNIMGISMEYQWNINGTSMEYQWNIFSKIQEQCSIRRPNLMATKMATLRAKAMAMAMAVAICRATWMEKTDGGKCNGNIGGKKHWQILGGGKSTGGKLNGKILAASKSPWQHTWQRKGKLALRAKAIATQVAKLWQKMWQGLKTRRVSGKSRWHIAWPKDIVCSRWLAQAASGIVSYAKQVNIFNQIVVVSNDQT